MAQTQWFGVHEKKEKMTVVTMAEREGFEPSVEVFPLRRFSKPLPSAARPPLHQLPKILRFYDFYIQYKYALFSYNVKIFLIVVVNVA